MRNSPFKPLLAALAALSLAALACAWNGSGASSTDPELISQPITHAGLERSYYLVEPSQMTDPVPLVLSLHGGGGTGQQMCALAGGIQELADRERFLVACPEGVENHWNDGRANDRYRAHIEDIDDVGFLRALIDRLSTTYNVDPNRIYVTGVSNGGMMSLRMACEASDVIAAAGAVIASLPDALSCEPEQPISILLMNGTEDPLVPWEGGQVHLFRQELGEVLSTPDAVSFWVAANGCDPTPLAEQLPDIDPQDGTRIYVDTYSGCNGDVAVVLYTVEGGGHTLPGGTQYLPKLIIGRVSKDLHAGEAIWQFFENAP
ncbi:MAG: PHB depolymerase family esterase [Anaerolineales bacterium]